MCSVLGDFQTWIGVLASLLVLCIALGNNNLHSQILKGTKKRIRESIGEAERLMASFTHSLNIPNNPNNKVNGISPNRIKMLLLQAERQQRINVALANKPTIEKERVRTLKCIENRLISVTAPFYSLILCLLLFIFDGFGLLGWLKENVIMTFLSILLTVSMAYWSVMWTKDYQYVRHIINTKPLDILNKRSKQWINILNGMLAITIFVFFVALASHPEINISVGRMLVFGIGLAGGFIGTSLPMALKSLKGTNLPYSHIVVHTLVFTVYCGIATWILTGTLPWSKTTGSLLFAYSSTYPLVFFWSLFILVNGLIIPFMMTRWAYQLVGDKAMTHIDKQKATLEAELKIIDYKIHIIQNQEKYL